jgi:ribosomal protein S27AE
MSTVLSLPTTGARLSCGECGTLALVTKAAGGELECTGHGTGATNEMGKRKSCAQCGTEVLVAKPGSGELHCHGEAMTAADGRRLPTSD